MLPSKNCVSVTIPCIHCSQSYVCSEDIATKHTNKENVLETNYTNIQCDNCLQVYAVKIILETREG